MLSLNLWLIMDKPNVKRLGIADAFVQHGSVKELRALCGIDENAIYQAITQILSL